MSQILYYLGAPGTSSASGHSDLPDNFLVSFLLEDMLDSISLFPLGGSRNTDPDVDHVCKQ